MKPVIPDELIAQVARRNAVVFVGAGLSAGVGLPGWPRLLRRMIDWCEGSGIDLSNKADIEWLLDVKKDLLAAADALRSKMGDDRYRQFMEEVFLRPELRPTEVHKIIAKMPFVGAGTTNYDWLLEEGYREARPDEPLKVFTQVDHEQLGTALHAKTLFILKAHGTIERFDTLILGWKDYNTLIHGSDGYRTFLRALFINRTVLFLGFSMSDPELLLLLGGLREVFKGHTPTHYAFMDVSEPTTQTEQDQFEKNYGVKIIPYTPAAADHPEVKAFLTELSERVTQNAIWYQAEEMRRAAEIDDPHYRAVVTSDNEIIIKERYPGASEDHPLRLSVTVNHAGHEAIKRTLATGEPLKIKGEDIIDVKVPDILSRFFMITGHLGISSGVARGEKTLTVKATIECADGEIASLDNIVLENIQGGEEQMVLSNENQGVPWKFRQTVRFDNDESTLNFTFDDVGLPVKRALEGLRYRRALSKGGFFRFENVETGSQFAHAEIPPGVMPPPDEHLIRVLEALEYIQKKTGMLFTSPEGASRAEVENISAVEQILRTGRIGLKPPPLTYTSPDQARADFERFSGGASLHFMQYSDDWVFIILGQRVFLGPVLVSCEKMIMPPDDLEVLRKAIENGLSEDKPVRVSLAPAPGQILEARLLNWLPVEEAEQIRNIPFVKTTALTNFVGLLADASRRDGGGLSVEEFMDLLEDARGQMSEHGTPLNGLSSATTEELAGAFEPVAAGLAPDEKRRLAVSLFRRGWLPAGKAARLAGVKEETLTNEQGEQEAEHKSRPAVSDI